MKYVPYCSLRWTTLEFQLDFCINKSCCKINDASYVCSSYLDKGLLSKSPSNSHFLLHNFWAQSWRMQQNWSVHSDGPASQILIKSQSDQKMPLIFPLCIANSWPHTKFRWPMSPRSASRANSTLCSKSKSYFNENSGLVHYLLCTELYSQICAENPINIERAVVWLPFLETTIFFE